MTVKKNAPWSRVVPQSVGVSKDGRGLWIIHRNGSYRILAERWGRTALVGAIAGYPTQRDAILASAKLAA